MTEEEWTRHAEAMYLPSLRKQRLFLCAICRRILHLVPDKTCHKAIEVAERYADGLVSGEERQVSVNGVRAATLTAMGTVAEAARKSGKEPTNYVQEARRSGKPNALIAACCATVTCEIPLWQRGDASAIKNLVVLALVNSAEAMLFAELRKDSDELQAQQAIFRDINYGTVTSIAPSWLEWNSGEIRNLAQSIYHERTFDGLPILADALEEAGCNNWEILNHCREPGPHVRGCWVVDIVLGKE